MARSYHYIQTWHPKQKHLYICKKSKIAEVDTFSVSSSSYSSDLHFLEFHTLKRDICTQNTLLYLKCLTSYHPIPGAKEKNNPKTTKLSESSAKAVCGTQL